MNLLKGLENLENSLMIIGAHPDDIEFSTGRLILRRSGIGIYACCMTDGRKGQEKSEKERVPETQYALLREKESSAALDILGIPKEKRIFFRLPDQGLISNPFIVDKLFLHIKSANPDYLLIPPWEGAHPDHDAAHLFTLMAAKNAGFAFDRIIEYGSYNNFGGKLRVQEFIPFQGASEERLVPSAEEMNKWKKAMECFFSQESLREKYLPISHFESFRKIPQYDYTKLPYSKAHSEIIRGLLQPIYPFARRFIPEEGKMYYETWEDTIDPKNIKDRLNHYKMHYMKDD